MQHNTVEEINRIRQRLDSLTYEDLRALSPEDMTALMVTLRKVLDKTEGIKSAYLETDPQKWANLTT